MRPAAAVLVVALLSAGGARAGEVGAQVVAALAERPRVRVIVALREPRGTVGDLAVHNGAVGHTQASVLAGLEPDDFIVTHRWQSISALAGEVTGRGLRRLLEDPDVLQVDLDPLAFVASAESAALIRADQVRGTGVTGKGVVVAVIDTGVDDQHPDIRESVIAEQCFCASPSGTPCCPNGTAQQSGAGAAQDDHGHGTNVAGIITSDGRVAPPGIAPDAQIVAIKTLDRSGSGTSTSILSGLDYVINRRPEVKVVNMSLGLANLYPTACDSAASFTTGFASAINTLRARGVTVFASTANNGSSSQVAVPACIQNAVAVGAVYKADVGAITFGCTDATTAADRVACFSNSNGLVDVLAPGAPVTSAGLGGGLSTYLGTSQACPVAAAVAALLLQAHPGLVPDQVEAALKNTGVTVVDPKNGLSFRRIDAKAAVDSVR